MSLKNVSGEHMNEDFLALDELEGVIIEVLVLQKKEFVKGIILTMKLKIKS